MSGLSVYHCGYEKCPPAHSYGPAVRDHYLIHYVVSGKGEFITEYGISPLSAGDLFLIRPGQTTTYRAKPEDPYEYYWVGFNGAEAAQMIISSGYSNDHPIISYTKDEAALSYLKLLLLSAEDPVTAEFDMLGYLYLFLSCLIRSSADPAKKSASYNNILNRAVKYIHGNYSREVNISDIADFVRIDRSHLFRIFKDRLGVSPQEYLIGFRMAKAAELLSSYDINISQAAYSVGYPDPAHFSRSFKKLYSVSPSRFVNAKRSDHGKYPIQKETSEDEQLK